MEDGKIVDLFLARDTEAIKCTAQIYGTRLRRLAYGIVRDERDAEACENDTYLQAWGSIPPKEPRIFLFGYLAKITRNLALENYKRKNAAKRNTQLVALSEELDRCLSVADGPESKINGKDLCYNISIFLKMQSPERRNLFLRRYWYMDSVKELAERFFISESKVKNTLFRVRKELKEFLEEGGFSL